MIKEDKLYRTRKGKTVRVAFTNDGLAYYEEGIRMVGVWQKTGWYFADGRTSPFDLVAPASEGPQ